MANSHRIYQPSDVKNRRRPAPTTAQKGPLHNGGTRGTYDYNNGGAAPVPPAGRKRGPGEGK